MKNFLLLMFLTFLVFNISCKKSLTEPKNTLPTASFTINPTSGTTSTMFNFDASECTDNEDDSSVLQVRWDWDSDGIFDTDWNAVKTATHQFNSVGTYTIKLEVKDSNNIINETSNTVSISNTPPTASFTINPTTGTTSTTFNFDASGCTDNEDETSELQVRWDWDNDGAWNTSYDASKITTHKFVSASNYSVKLEVKDSGGLVDTLIRNVNVSIGSGAQIIEDTILTEDLKCESDDPVGITIASSNITLDLGGHTISNRNPNISSQCIGLENVNNVTIKNGVIENFMIGIGLGNSSNLTIENVTIKNLQIGNPNTFVIGINIGDCNNLNIINSKFEFIAVAHKEAIISYSSTIYVDNIELIGGSVGVNFSFHPNCEPGSNNQDIRGSVTNCKFTDATIAGVLVACSDSILIKGNEFIRNEVGVQAYGPCFGSIINTTIEDNYIHDGYIGIDFLGVTESTISNNIIQNNGWHGIMMSEDMICRIYGTNDDCFYSTNNLISSNVVTGNIIDLSHHDNAIGNTWINNTYDTKEGVDIPEP